LLSIETFEVVGECGGQVHAPEHVLDLDLQQNRLFGLGRQLIGALLQLGATISGCATAKFFVSDGSSAML
jgi:hypothetical protein